MDEDKKKRLPAPAKELELELAPEEEVQEFPCPYCCGIITLEVTDE